MKRKRITELAPWLLPLRQWQRNLFFYTKMRFDKNKYATHCANEELKEVLFEDKSILINESSGMDIQYQYNKVHNVRLAASTINKVILMPNEIFSFWQCVRKAKKLGKYKDGLSLLNGELVHVYGGGLCQISNLLFWCFVHSPLTLVERHTHYIKAFPNPPSDIPEGMDATISEGWKDLKARNDTEHPIQIILEMDEDYLYCRITSDVPTNASYQIEDRNLRFVKRQGRIIEEVTIVQLIQNKQETVEKILYTNQCAIGYSLPEGTFIEEE